MLRLGLTANPVGCRVYTMIRTNIFLSKPQKESLEKLAKEKDISVAELVRRIIDKELEEVQKKKK
jgi:hypothetical protein